MHTRAAFVLILLTIPTWAPEAARAHISPSVLRPALREATERARACGPLPGGRYAVRATFDGGGAPHEVVLRDHPSGLDPVAERCVVSAFLDARLPALGRTGSISVVWPFVVATSEDRAPP